MIFSELLKSLDSLKTALNVVNISPNHYSSDQDTNENLGKNSNKDDF